MLHMSFEGYIGCRPESCHKEPVLDTEGHPKNNKKTTKAVKEES